jgi:hypothetical protein
VSRGVSPDYDGKRFFEQTIHLLAHRTLLTRSVKGSGAITTFADS